LASLPPLPNPPPRRGEGVISLSLNGSEANLAASDGGTNSATSLSLDGRGIEGEGDFTPVSFTEFEAAYKTLGDKLRP